MGDEDETAKKKANALPTWGNAQTMNINNLIVTNILSSPYFKNQLFKLKTFHEVVDEIYYKVDHLEPWERGSRKTHGQVGMCGGVRGVGAGGIVSSGFCLLFKLFTLKLTEKQLAALINHTDSPYIRGLGFMYIRYCLPPNTFWDWYEPYLEDDEQIDPKAGSGSPMTIGQMIRSFLLKLDWYGTLFPRIPVPIHKEIEANLKEYNLCDDRKVYAEPDSTEKDLSTDEKKKTEESFGEAERYAKRKREEKDRERSPHQQKSTEHGREHRSSSHRDESRRESNKDVDRSPNHRHLESSHSRSHNKDRKDARNHDRHDKYRERSRDGERLSDKHRDHDKYNSEHRKSTSLHRSHSKEKHR